jgi:hypothetical protein
LVKLATPPVGSIRLDRWSATDGTALLSAPGTPDDPDKVDLTEFFLAPGGNRALNWLKDQVPKGGSTAGSGSSSGPGTDDEQFLSFSFRGTSILPSPELQYSMVITPKGLLGLRVDATVLWTPQKSPVSIVPTGAPQVVVTFNRGLNVTANIMTKVVVNDHGTISSILSKVNDLPVAFPGVSSCPADFGASMTLQFFLEDATNPYATVIADPGGCGSVTVEQFDANGALLGTAHDSGGYALVKYVATDLDITNWSGAPAPLGMTNS